MKDILKADVKVQFQDLNVSLARILSPQIVENINENLTSQFQDILGGKIFSQKEMLDMVKIVTKPIVMEALKEVFMEQNIRSKLIEETKDIIRKKIGN